MSSNGRLELDVAKASVRVVFKGWESDIDDFAVLKINKELCEVSFPMKLTLGGSKTTNQS